MPLIKTATLGCKVNQYETELVREALLGVGYADAAAEQPADLCVVNTCTVTADGDSKSRQTIRRLARENPQARIVVMGCYATRAPHEVAALPGVQDIITDKRELPDWLQRWGVNEMPTGISGFVNHRRAFVKVQDGCLLNCTYCIIPQVRPHVASRPPEHVEEEIRRLAANGYREIVLTGIHLGHYGVEWNRGRAKRDWVRLADLVRRLAQIPGDFRLRLSSIEATEVTRELIAVLAEFPEKVCPHLHVCLQSGSDAVLARMHRRWGRQRFIDRCQLVQSQLARPALTTDVLIGFPGETEADFADTCGALQTVGFSKLHVFTFSARSGTPAATMPNQVAAPVVAQRRARLLELENDLRTRYYAQLIGQPLQVLVEARESGSSNRVLGTACRYATVDLPGDALLHGRMLSVTPTQLVGEHLVVGAT